MPVYQYECRKCGHEFDARRSIDENEDQVKCPSCEEPNPRRVYSAFCGFTPGGSCAPRRFG
jgi:putative FmdB family regulatory protein